ncbi:hypothetical protein C8J57DRAFT_1357403 [Mycena rebaudengoi]|nr:hypothetical protein C8J57DRAFT_1357403 [Mycena rebaudengoi]
MRSMNGASALKCSRYFDIQRCANLWRGKFEWHPRYYFSRRPSTHGPSTLLTVYILGYCNHEHRVAYRYLERALALPAWDMYNLDISPWIRRSTGQLCLTMIAGRRTIHTYAASKIFRPCDLISRPKPYLEALVISSLTFKEYYTIWYYNLVKFRQFT